MKHKKIKMWESSKRRKVKATRSKDKTLALMINQEHRRNYRKWKTGVVVS